MSESGFLFDDPKPGPRAAAFFERRLVPAPPETANVDLDAVWWGPVDGPRPENSVRSRSVSCGVTEARAGSIQYLQTAKRLSSPLRSCEVGLRQKMEETSRLRDPRDSDLNQVPGATSSDSGEASRLREEIAHASACRRALQIEAQQNTEHIRRLEESQRRLARRIGELDSHGDSFTTEEGLSDEVWREAVETLETELRRKSTHVVQLHRRVHDLEAHLWEQLQNNDSRVVSTYNALQKSCQAMHMLYSPLPQTSASDGVTLVV